MCVTEWSVFMHLSGWSVCAFMDVCGCVTNCDISHCLLLNTGRMFYTRGALARIPSSIPPYYKKNVHVHYHIYRGTSNLQSSPLVLLSCDVGKTMAAILSL